MSTSEVLPRITSALDRVGINYMLTGSLASAHYGAARSTLDIDIVIEATAEQLTAFVRSLPVTEYYVNLDAALDAHRHQSLFNVIDTETGWKIDLILRKSRAFSLEEFGRRSSINVQGHQLFVASVEDVVIAKLEWSKLAQSQRQVEDVASILKIRSQTLDKSYIRKWVSELEIEPQWEQAKLAAGIFQEFE
jgi:hypothetical protein